MKTILYAKTIKDLLSQIKNNKGIQVVGGCTRLSELPEKSISTFGISELSQIVRHERYFDIGAGTTLSAILQIGQNHLPQVLYEALQTIANPIIRNTATIGGNICEMNHKLTLYAPLLALDAKLDFVSQTETITEPLLNFKEFPKDSVLTGIKIPNVDADISIFRRIGPENKITQRSASFAFIAATEKDTISSLRLAFAGPFAFRSKTLENDIIGKRLPLSQKDISEILEMVKQEFYKTATDQMISDVLTQQFFNLTKYSFEQLS